MKTLPLNLRKNGFSYTQLFRTENKAIYKQTVSTKIEYFEVFIIQSRPERIIKGKIISSGEKFPNDESFGVMAWTYISFCKALNKYNTLPK